MPLISSTHNPLVRQVRSLMTKKGRQESGLFLVEGVHHVGEAFAAGWEITHLVHAPDLLSSEFGRKLVEEKSRSGTPSTALTAELFTSIAGKENPQGLLAITRQKHTPLEAAPAGLRLAAAVVSPQDPGNIGTILRSLDAVAGEALFLLDGGVELYHPSVVRASMGALFWIPVIHANFDDFNRWRQNAGLFLVGSSAHASTDYRSFDPGRKRTVLLLGSEQKGLSNAHSTACDTLLALPMRGRTSSLNLAVAAGILLYTLSEK